MRKECADQARSECNQDMHLYFGGWTKSDRRDLNSIRGDRRIRELTTIIDNTWIDAQPVYNITAPTKRNDSVEEVKNEPKTEKKPKKGSIKKGTKSRVLVKGKSATKKGPELSEVQKSLKNLPGRKKAKKNSKFSSIEPKETKSGSSISVDKSTFMSSHRNWAEISAPS